MQGWSAHERNPVLVPERPTRVLYIVGNPYNQLLSFQRRGFLRAPYEHCKHVSGDVLGISQRPAWTLQEYLENGEDFFGLAEHFDGWWTHRDREYEIMFVRYETLPRVMVQLCDWFGIEKPFEFRQRRSDVFKQPTFITAGLVKMYGRFAQQVCALPDCVVKGPGDA